MEDWEDYLNDFDSSESEDKILKPVEIDEEVRRKVKEEKERRRKEEEEERRKKEMLEEVERKYLEEIGDVPTDVKEKERKISDLNAAIDTFMGSDYSESSEEPDPSIWESIDKFEPTTTKDFEHLATMIADKINNYYEDINFKHFWNEFFKYLMEPWTIDQVKEAGTLVNVIRNAKIESFKGKKKKKKKAAKKAVLNMRNPIDPEDFYDFM